MFKDHAKGVLDVDGVSLALTYHHVKSELSRSRSRERGERRDEPSVTLIIKGIDPNTSEGTLAATFQPFATIKDIRHFARRGFAFLQFHSVDEASVALSSFQRNCRSRLDGVQVVCHFAKEREDDTRFLGAERAFLKKQAMATEQATVELEKIAQQQVQEANASQALSGVNGDMWASYLQSYAQTETVQSSNTFKYDKDSGFYIDQKAGLFYDPNTTYFFTLDYKKYFVYDHDEKMLCLVDKSGNKAPHGERRPLPSSGSLQRSPREQAAPRDRRSDRARSRSVRGRLPRDRSHSRPRGRSRERAERGDRDRNDRDRSHERERERERRRPFQPREPMPDEDGAFKPIYFPGGDPLAKLAPAAESPAKAAPQAKKKTKPAAEVVLGLASVPKIKKPGKVTVLSGAPKPGPVTILQPQTTDDASGIASAMLFSPGFGSTGTSAASGGGLGSGLGASGLAGGTGALGAGLVARNGTLGAGLGNGSAGIFAAPVAQTAPANLPALGDWICEVCMRKFNSEEMLRKHEALSDLHKQNLAKLAAAG